MLNEKMNGKKILFFSVQTFNLEKEIIKKLQQSGAEVDYYDERPSNSNFTKGIIRIKRSLYAHKITEYYENILTAIKNKKYDFLLVNRGEVIPAFFLERFKVEHPECFRIFYTWDSFSNHAHPTTILKYFDKKMTFDSEDAVKFGIEFRPLFYLDSYKEIKKYADEDKEYDLLFLGTAHSDRYIISTLVANWCKSQGLISFCYYFIHGRLVFLYKKLLDKSFKHIQYNKLSFKSLTTSEILELYKKSDVILDINHPGQKGLTMRTFESLGAGKKMITTNAEIKKYSFYNPENFYIIDRNNIRLDKSFFEKKYSDVSPDLYERASMNGWLSCIFLESEPGVWIKDVK